MRKYLGHPWVQQPAATHLPRAGALVPLQAARPASEGGSQRSPSQVASRGVAWRRVECRAGAFELPQPARLAIAATAFRRFSTCG